MDKYPKIIPKVVVATDGDPDEFSVAPLIESNNAALADTEIAAMQPIAITRKEGIQYHFRHESLKSHENPSLHQMT